VWITSVVDLSAWPEGTRMIARRKPCHPSAQVSSTDLGGCRYQVFVIDSTADDVAYLENLQRGPDRAERLTSDAKDTSLSNVPFAAFEINPAWLAVVRRSPPMSWPGPGAPPRR
jgi:hypothetical protein